MEYILVYEKNTQFLYFLTLKSDGWKFLEMDIVNKNSPQKEIMAKLNEDCGIIKIKSLKKIDNALHDIYLADVSMNSPIKICKKYSTYSWDKVDDVLPKLKDPVLSAVFVEANEFLR